MLSDAKRLLQHYRSKADLGVKRRNVWFLTSTTDIETARQVRAKMEDERQRQVEFLKE